jgi:transcriptional regulator with XRE-family HTH domain
MRKYTHVAGDDMTHLQETFVRNLRYYRSQAGYTQTKLSIQLNVSPNYLNAVENGKNFPSPAVIQQMLDILHLLPYQLFLEEPAEYDSDEHAGKTRRIQQELTRLKQQFDQDIDHIITQYGSTGMQ